MKKLNLFFISLFIFLSATLFAHNAADHHEKKAAHADPYIQSILDQVAFLQNRITSLAEAIPEDKYSWRPGEGVRSTGEQLVHTLAAAYGIPSMMGAEMPSHINMEIEKTMTQKEEIMKNLTASFESASIFLQNYDTANYDEIVKTPFGEFTQRNMILILNNHYHEHLGQLIVYARSNGVVPPWSEKSN
jgi:uncharacterized damage-inducible protein DinB